MTSTLMTLCLALLPTVADDKTDDGLSKFASKKGKLPGCSNGIWGAGVPTEHEA